MRCLRLAVMLVLLGLSAGCDALVEPGSTPGASPGGLLGGFRAEGGSGATALEGMATYQVAQHLRLVNHGPGTPTKQHLWLALIQDMPPYQEVIASEISPNGYQAVTDEYGNRYAEFDFSGMAPGTEIVVEAKYRVAVQALSYDLGECLGPLPDVFNQPELHIESANPQIRGLAAALADGLPTACEQARAYYDYVGEHLVYSFNGRDWGAQAALGPMGADCTEYSSLFIALARSSGMPARYLAGLRYVPEGSDPEGRIEHAWAEIFFPGFGWAPVDPTLGRSSVARAGYFGRLPADHIIVTRGRTPSTLRGANYFSHLYWPGQSTDIRIEETGWLIEMIPG